MVEGVQQGPVLVGTFFRGRRVLHHDVVGSRGFFHKHAAIPGP